MAPVITTQRQLLRRDQRRAQILRAAAQAFSRDGYVATSVEEVAKQAGITKLIVYRHFDSKAALYRAILDEVATRLGEVWGLDTDEGHPHGSAVRTLLTVARELPDGFRLLFVHAAREQEFREYAEGFRKIQEELADRVVAELVTDEPLRTWTVRMTVRVVVASVLEWIDVGSPDDDEEFIERSTAGIRSLVLTVTAPIPA
jgi:AcrR family transcriptional regulator